MSTLTETIVETRSGSRIAVQHGREHRISKLEGTVVIERYKAWLDAQLATSP
jgi:hypothetical protein